MAIHHLLAISLRNQVIHRPVGETPLRSSIKYTPKAYSCQGVWLPGSVLDRKPVQNTVLQSLIWIVTTCDIVGRENSKAC